MTISYGPFITTTGLRICLDAGNPRSYLGNSTTWGDCTGNGFNASLTNSPGYSTNNKGYFTFNGSNQYGAINVNSFVRSNSTAYTFSSFFNYAASNTGAPYILMTSPNTSDAGDGFWQHFNIGGNWLWRTEDTVTGELGGTVVATPFVVGSWYNLTTVVKTNSILYYINGNLSYTISPTFSWANLTSGETAYIFLGIGYLSAGAIPAYYFNGYIGNFLFYNIELNSNQILQNFNALRGRYGI